MNRRQQEVLRRQIRHWRNEVRWNTSWQHICEQFELLERIEGRFVRFQVKDREWLRAQAKRSGYGDLLFDDAPTGSRIDAAGDGLINEKLALIKPDQQYVLLTAQGGELPCADMQHLPAGQSLRVCIDELVLEKIQTLVIIENLDLFDHWHLANLPPELSQAVATYRGHDALAKGVLQLVERLPETAQIVVFPDLDPDGLKIAFTTPRVSGLLACDINESLTGMGSPDDFVKQHQAAKFLENAELKNWQPLWAELKRIKRSIKQQHIVAQQLPLSLLLY